MKRTAAILLTIYLCAALAACGAEAEQVNSEPVVSQPPAASEDQPATNVLPEVTGFREDDYIAVESVTPDGTKVIEYYTDDTYSQRVRFYCEYPNGEISDECFYPNGNMSYGCWYFADGASSCSYYSEDGAEIKNIQQSPDGEYGERSFYENGSQKSYVFTNSATGASGERLYYENGNLKSGTVRDPAAESCQTEEYYENGQRKYFYSEQPGQVLEEKFDEDGFRFYHLSKVDGITFITEYYRKDAIKYQLEKAASYTVEQKYDEEGYTTYYINSSNAVTLELIADDSGALAKVIIDEVELRDPEDFARYTQEYNFRE